jgi:uncharacterized Zn finger protein
MLWAVDRELEDQWSLCEGVEVFWKQEKKETEWNILADELIKRLKGFSKAKNDRYDRDRLTDWIITALKNAGRKDEIVPLCEKEAVRTDSYVRLVRILMEANQWKAAEQCIQKGIRATDKKWPGIAGRPRQFPIIGTLIDIAIAEKRPDKVVHWYDKRKKQKFGGWWSEFQEDKIAKALADDYPDRAVDIWKRLAANLIAQVKPKAYEKAAVHLKKIQRTLKRQSKDKEWGIYLANIRKEHARKI